MELTAIATIGLIYLLAPPCALLLAASRAPADPRTPKSPAIAAALTFLCAWLPLGTATGALYAQLPKRPALLRALGVTLAWGVLGPLAGAGIFTFVVPPPEGTDNMVGEAIASFGYMLAGAALLMLLLGAHAAWTTYRATTRANAL